MNFGKALEAVKDGGQAARAGWDGRWVALLDPGANAQMTQRYLYDHKSNGEQVPWNPSHGDLLAEDWETE